MKLNKNIRQALSYFLIVIMVITMSPAMLPATAFATSDPNGGFDPISTPDQDTFKYLQIMSASTQRYMSHCFYKDNKAEYYSPFVIDKEDAIISFTIYATQNCSLRLYKYNGSEMNHDPNDPNDTDTKPYYDNGLKFDFLPENMEEEYIGTIVGVQMLENIIKGEGEEEKRLPVPFDMKNVTLSLFAINI